MRDAVYYFYRAQPKSVDAGKPSVEHKYGPVADVVYITANLTAPAELRVTQGGEDACGETSGRQHRCRGADQPRRAAGLRALP